MHYYQTTMSLPVPCGDLYVLHQTLDSYIRRMYLGEASNSPLRHELDAVPQYGYRAVPRNDTSSIVMLRSRQPIGLPDERQLRFTVEQGDRVSFQYLPCVTTKRDSGRTSHVLPIERLADDVIAPRLLRAGLQASSIDVRGVDRLHVRKPNCKPFFLAGAHVQVEAEIIDPDAAMSAFIGGIGHKTAFGFGLPLQLSVTKAGG